MLATLLRTTGLVIQEWKTQGEDPTKDLHQFCIMLLVTIFTCTCFCFQKQVSPENQHLKKSVLMKYGYLDGEYLLKVIIINYFKDFIFSGWPNVIRIMTILYHTKF